jgi:hypothetical protein
LKTSLHTLSASLVTGYIFFYYSELVFWARPRPEDSLLNWVQTWLAYSLMAFLFLAAVHTFHARSLPAVFLCGAFFGWLGEGVLVQTAYEDLPLSLSFTGLAWHALISVLAGWYGLQKALRHGLRQSLLAALFTGLFVWFWGVCWLYEEPQTSVTPGVFAVYHLVASLPLMASLSLVPKIFARPFAPSRWTVWIVGGLFLALFVIGAVPAAPLAAVILPALMILLYAGLRRNRLRESRQSVLEMLAQPAPRRHYLTILLIPLIASALYSIYWLTGLRLPTNWVVYLVTTPAGFIRFGWSLWKVWR